MEHKDTEDCSWFWVERLHKENEELRELLVKAQSLIIWQRDERRRLAARSGLWPHFWTGFTIGFVAFIVGALLT